MTRAGWVIVAAAAVLIVVVWYFALYKPKSDDVASTKDEVAAAETEGQSLEATLARLQAIDQPQQQATLERLNAAIPETPDLADFIFQANNAAAESGVDWLSISPSPPAASATGGPTEITLSIQVSGGFFQVLDYLNRLESVPRLVVVDSVNVTAGGGDAAGTDAATTQTTLSTSTSDSTTPTLNVTLSGKMFTRSTDIPGAPGDTSGGTSTTPAPATPAPTTAPAGGIS
jgi:Tfp pilus assembly protein PilO